VTDQGTVVVAVPSRVLLLRWQRLRLSEHRDPQGKFRKACKALDDGPLRLRGKGIDWIKPWHRRDEVSDSEAGESDKND
jgi:hypothetical protein